METEKIELPKQLMDSIRELVKKNNFVDEEDFINQAIIKHIAKFK